MITLPFGIDELLFFIGFALAFGYATSLVFQKIGVPNVVVYLLSGFLISSVLLPYGVDVAEDLEELFKMIEIVALGLIGFKIGTELKFGIMKKEPRLISIFLLFEAGGAFLLVFLSVFIYSHEFLLSLLLASLAMATAPAATMEIIRKFRAEGPMTTRLQWILAFDDVVAITFVEGIIVYVSISLGHELSLINYFIRLGEELGIAIVIGLILGYLLDLIVERLEDPVEMMEITLGFLILSMGISHSLHTSVITTTMVIGATVTNLKGQNYIQAGDLLEVIMSPVLMLFFVLIGARVTLGDFYPFPILVIFYLIGRTVGKIGGIYLGGNYVEVDDTIKDNLGFGLLAQGGVALGLMAVVNDILTEAGRSEMGDTIILTIVISTIISEAIGSFGTIFAIRRSGESGKIDNPIYELD